MKKLLPETYKNLNHTLPNSFAEAHYDVRDYLGDGVFLLSDGDLAIMWEISGIYDEILEPDELIDELTTLQKALRQVVPGIPAFKNLGNTTLQIFLRSRRIEKIPEKIVNGKPYEFTKGLLGEFLSAEEECLFDWLNFTSRRFYLGLRFTPNPDDRNLREKVSDFFQNKEYLEFFKTDERAEDTFQEIEKAKAVLVNETERIEDILANHCKLNRLEPNELIEYVQDILNSYQEAPLYPSEEEIHKAIKTFKMEATESGIRNHQDGFSDVYYLDQLPRRYTYGAMRHFIDWIPHPNFDLVWTFSYGTSKPRNEINGRIAYFEGKKSKQDVADDFREFKKAISPFNPYGIQSLRLIVHNPPDSFESGIQNAANDYLYSSMVKETQIPVHMLTTSLPLNSNRFTNGLKGRSRKILLDKALAFLPLYDGPPNEHGTMFRLSRSGTPTRWDPHAGEGNKHAAAIGTSRVGKSVFTNYLAALFLEYNPKTIIRGIDFRTSYRKLSDLVGGRIIVFSEDELRANPYSPFALEDWNSEDLKNLKYLIKATILAKNPAAEFSDPHDNILRTALSLAFESHENNVSKKAAGIISGEIAPHPIWENIVAQFPRAKAILESGGTGNLDYVVEDLNRWTISFKPGGDFDFIFSEHQLHRDSDHEERMLIYDLDGISDPVLRQVASMLANVKIMRDLTRYPGSIEKLIILDELGQQIRGDKASGLKSLQVMGEMIINIAATAAKMNAQIVALTNQVGDYTDNPVGKAVWNIAQTHIFLPMGSLFKSAYNCKDWRQSFNDAEWSIIKSLKLDKKNKRSAFYVASDNDTAPYRGSCYLPLSTYMDALTTTSGPQLELYQKLMKDGLSPKDAIGFMAEKHPYGEGLKKDPRDEDAQKEMQGESI